MLDLYREYAADGTTITLSRETFQVAAGDTMVGQVETRTGGTDSAPRAAGSLLSTTNHLGSAVLELDDEAAIVSYEEYFPFGSTSYQAVASRRRTWRNGTASRARSGMPRTRCTTTARGITRRGWGDGRRAILLGLRTRQVHMFMSAIGPLA